MNRFNELSFKKQFKSILIIDIEIIESLESTKDSVKIWLLSIFIKNDNFLLRNQLIFIFTLQIK